MKSKAILTFLAAAALAALATVASAATYTHNCTAQSANGPNKPAKMIEYKLGTALDVVCVDNDNDKGGQGFFDDNPAVFGKTGWKLYDSIDATGTGLNGDFQFGNSTMAANDQSNMGKITIDNNDLLAYDSILIVLKEANSFAAFLVDKTDTSWDWMTNFTISHASIWYHGDADDDNNPPVPLPATGWLLIGGLGGLAVMRRRKKT